MRIETVTIKGVMRFVEAVTLDLHDATGLVAVIGDNGAGKTTTMEAALACFYRTFPTRPDKEVFDYATASDAFIETTFTLEGRGTYCARLSLDGPRRKSEAVLSRVESDGRLTALTDGKVSSYDAAIAALLPPLSSLLASVFSAQNRAGSFASLDKKGRKQLFTSLLGLDAYDLWALRARTEEQVAEQQSARATTRLETLERDASQALLDETVAAAQGRETGIAAVETTRAELAARIAATEGTIAGLREAATRHAATRSRLDVLETELRSGTAEREAAVATILRVRTDAEAERTRLVATYEEDLRAFDRRIADRSGVETAYARIATHLETQLRDVDERIANNQKIIDAGAEIRTAVASADSLSRAIDQGVADATRLQTRIADLVIERREVQEKIGEKNTIARALEGAQRDAGLLTSVPCRGEGAFAGCQFLADATDAVAQIPRLRADCEGRDQLEAELERIRVAIEDTREQLRALQQELEGKRATKLAAEQVAKRQSDLDVAAERIKGHEERRKDLVTQAELSRGEVDARELDRVAGLRQQRVDREQRHAADLAALTARTSRTVEDWETRANAIADRLTAVLFEIDGLRDDLATTAYASHQAGEAQAALAAQQQAWLTLSTELARLQQQHEDLRARVADLQRRRAECDTLRAEVDQHAEDVRDFQLLSKALGRDGLPTLEIDAAGPTVSAFCNDLLRSCFGGRFSVDLVTQEAKATKGKDGSTHKEVFELQVYDTERAGEARDLADLSGGEQVLVDEALKSAIALLVNTKNQHPIRTCFRDETTGALDGENATRYVEMLRRVQQLGGFSTLLYVTHNPDAAVSADAQVVVSDGRIELRQAPFGAAA